MAYCERDLGWQSWSCSLQRHLNRQVQIERFEGLSLKTKFELLVK